MAVVRRNPGFDSTFDARAITSALQTFADTKAREAERQLLATQSLETFFRDASDEGRAAKAKQLRGMDDKRLKRTYGKNLDRAGIETLIGDAEGFEDTPVQREAEAVATQQEIKVGTDHQGLKQKRLQTKEIKTSLRRAEAVRVNTIQQTFLTDENLNVSAEQAAEIVNAMEQGGEAYAKVLVEKGYRPETSISGPIADRAEIYINELDMSQEDALARATREITMPLKLQVDGALLANSTGKVRLSLLQIENAVEYFHALESKMVEMEFNQVQLDLARARIRQIENDIEGGKGSASSASLNHRINTELAAIPIKVTAAIVGMEKFEGIPLTADGQSLQGKSRWIRNLFTGIVGPPEAIPVNPREIPTPFNLALWTAMAIPDDPSNFGALAEAKIPFPKSTLDMASPGFAELQVQAFEAHTGYQIDNVQTVSEDGKTTHNLSRDELVQQLHFAHVHVAFLRDSQGRIDAPLDEDGRLKLSGTKPRTAVNPGGDATTPDDARVPSEGERYLEELGMIQKQMGDTLISVDEALEEVMKELESGEAPQIIDAATPPPPGPAAGPPSGQ